MSNVQAIGKPESWVETGRPKGAAYLPRHAIALAEIVSRTVAGEGSIIELVVTVTAKWEEA
jgi:hypothetical protein